MKMRMKTYKRRRKIRSRLEYIKKRMMNHFKVSKKDLRVILKINKYGNKQHEIIWRSEDENSHI